MKEDVGTSKPKKQVSEDIISILVDQNFTMNATGMVLESL